MTLHCEDVTNFRILEGIGCKKTKHSKMKGHEIQLCGRVI
jgi:hypothetical protein